MRKIGCSGLQNAWLAVLEVQEAYQRTLLQMRRLWLLSFLFPTIAGGLPLTRKNDGATAVAPPNAASLQTGSQGFSNRKRANEDGDLAGLIAEDILYRAYIQFGTDGWADMQECVEREVNDNVIPHFSTTTH